MLLFISVELDQDGKPDLQLPASVQIDKHQWGAWVTWPDGALAMYHLGVLGGQRRFLCDGTRQAAQKLAHLGAAVQRARDLVPMLSQPQIDWLAARGARVTRVNGTPRGLFPPMTRCGNSPLGLGLDGVELSDGDVVEVDGLVEVTS